VPLLLWEIFVSQTNELVCCLQAAIGSQSSSVKVNSNSEIQLAEHSRQLSGGELPQADNFIRKGKLPESDLLETSSLEKVGWKRNGSSSEAKASTSESVMAQAKATTVKSRQTHSGPLMPGTVFSHSLSERGRTSERFVVFLFSFSYSINKICLN